MIYLRPIVLAVLLAPTLALAGALEQMRQFLGSTKTLRAEFVQEVMVQGGRKPQHSSGQMAISRPGKLRWEVSKPYPQLLVGDGEKFWIYDPELAQVTVKKIDQAIGSTPAAILAGNNEFERNFVLRDDGERDGLQWLLAIPKKPDSGFEKLRLGFVDNMLMAMEMFDSFGQITLLKFAKIERNPDLPASLFRFVPPAGVDVVGD